MRAGRVKSRECGSAGRAFAYHVQGPGSTFQYCQRERKHYTWAKRHSLLLKEQKTDCMTLDVPFPVSVGQCERCSACYILVLSHDSFFFFFVLPFLLSD